MQVSTSACQLNVKVAKEHAHLAGNDRQNSALNGSLEATVAVSQCYLTSNARTFWLSLTFTLPHRLTVTQLSSSTTATTSSFLLFLLFPPNEHVFTSFVLTWNTWLTWLIDGITFFVSFLTNTSHTSWQFTVVNICVSTHPLTCVNYLITFAIQTHQYIFAFVFWVCVLFLCKTVFIWFKWKEVENAAQEGRIHRAGWGWCAEEPLSLTISHHLCGQ